MKTVAFLQNLWVKNPARVQAMFDRAGEEQREYLLHSLLFLGGQTGRRLRAAFGDACEEIIWEESTRQIGGVSQSSFPPDPAHIRAVLKKHQPTVILAFGKIAADAVEQVWRYEFPNGAREMIIAQHPTARGSAKAASLDLAAQQYRNLLPLFPVASVASVVS